MRFLYNLQKDPKGRHAFGLKLRDIYILEDCQDPNGRQAAQRLINHADHALDISSVPWRYSPRHLKRCQSFLPRHLDTVPLFFAACVVVPPRSFGPVHRSGAGHRPRCASSLPHRGRRGDGVGRRGGSLGGPPRWWRHQRRSCGESWTRNSKRPMRVEETELQLLTM